MKYALCFLLILVCQNVFAVYGENVQVSRDSFVVTLYNKDILFCSGVLISPTKVLTAGHCIDGRGLEAYSTSHALIYQPELLTVKVGKKNIVAKTVTFSRTYFDGFGLETEDLALIELTQAVKNVSPIKLAKRTDLLPKMKLTLIAQNKKVTTTLVSTKEYGESLVLFLDEAAGTCLGDSGGALTINKNGQQLLAGILIHSTEEACTRKNGYSFFPKEQL